MKIAVDGTRLWNNLQQQARYGATPRGGLRRLALTDEDKQARDALVAAARRRNFGVEVDQVGNIFISRPGTDPSLPPVLTGSHLDTTPTGGRFDGIFGVLAGLEVLETLADHQVATTRTLQVVNWTNEEGVRFAPAMLGSMVFAGVLPLEKALDLHDASGLRLGDELQRIGYAGDLPVPGRRLHAALEAHIEQGPLLEEKGYEVGIVTGVQGQISFDVRVLGMEAHSGSTPMSMRHDALVAAAEMCRAVRRLALDHGPAAVATVGRFVVFPGARNTVPGRVDFSVDLRVPDNRNLLEMEAALQKRCAEIAAEHQVTLQLERLWLTPPLHFADSCIACLTATAGELKLKALPMISGAGHDACQLHRVAPTGMLFVPCEKGISHNEAEYARPEDLTRGANLLLHSLLALAET